MAVTLAEIAERFSQIIQPVRGDLNFKIQGLAAPRQAQLHDLIFIQDKKHLAEAKDSQAQCWIVHPNLVTELKSGPPQLLSSTNGQLAVALIGRHFFAPQLHKPAAGEPAVHPSAVIAPSAQLGQGVFVGPNTTIGARAKIADHVIIGANTTIEAEVEIGEGSHIHSQVFIGYQTQIGKNCEIQPQTSIGTEGFGYAHDKSGNHIRMAHLGKVIIEDRVQIGSNVSIDRGTFEDCVFGAGTIIDNHCHFGHNNRFGKGNIVTAGMISAGSVTVGDFCTFGGRTSITGHIQVASHSQFAGLSGIHNTVEKSGAYGGYPLQPLKKALKTTASLAKLIELRKNVAVIMKHLGLQSAGDE